MTMQWMMINMKRSWRKSHLRFSCWQRKNYAHKSGWKLEIHFVLSKSILNFMHLVLTWQIWRWRANWQCCKILQMVYWGL